MAPPRAAFPLGECHPSILQRIIELCDREDLFLLRQVARRFREVVDRRVRSVRPRQMFPEDLAARFPRLESLNMECFWLSSAGLAQQLGPELAQLPHLRELKSLSLSEGHLPVQWQTTLQAMTRLDLKEHLTAEMAGDAVASAAAHCRSLLRLQIDASQWHWDPMHALVAQVAGTLTELHLHGYCEPESVPAGLAQLNTGRLQAMSLYLRSEDEPEEGNGQDHVGLPVFMHELAAFTSLSRLSLCWSELDDEGIEQLNALTRLTALDLAYTAVTCGGVAQLTALTRVQDLCMTQLSARPPAIEQHGVVRRMAPVPLAAALAGFPRLTRLNISYCRELRVGTALQTLSGLTRLHGANLGLLEAPQALLTRLDGGRLGLVQMPQALKALTQLRCLDLFTSLSDEAQLRHVSGLVGLTLLRMSSSVDCGRLRFSGSGLRWLARLTALQKLCLVGDYTVQSGAFQQLALLPRLNALCLDGTHMQLPSLAPLKRLPLRWLWLPSRFRSADELPQRLRAAYLKGCRGNFDWHCRLPPFF